MVAIKGHFDGKVFVPDEPVDLPQGQRLILHIEPTSSSSQSTGDAWTILDTHAGSVIAPADWSAEHDHYLYGSTKRSGK